MEEPIGYPVMKLSLDFSDDSESVSEGVPESDEVIYTGCVVMEDEVICTGYVTMVDKPRDDEADLSSDSFCEAPELSVSECMAPAPSPPSSQQACSASQSSLYSLRSNRSSMKNKTTALPYVFKTVYKEICLRNITPPSYDRALSATDYRYDTEDIGKYVEM
jgi:hypothetical protein